MLRFSEVEVQLLDLYSSVFPPSNLCFEKFINNVLKI
jgi:hypothetical protein